MEILVSKYLWDYITFNEYSCDCCKRLPPEFYDEDGKLYPDVPEIYRRIFKAFVDIRKAWGQPIPITDGYRCIERQKQMYKQGVSSAWISPHMTGLALDLDFKDADDTMKAVQIVKKIHPELRLGYKQYLYKGQSFIHIDCAYLVKPNFIKDWQPGVRW